MSSAVDLDKFWKEPAQSEKSKLFWIYVHILYTVRLLVGDSDLTHRKRLEVASRSGDDLLSLHTWNKIYILICKSNRNTHGSRHLPPVVNMLWLSLCSNSHFAFPSLTVNRRESEKNEPYFSKSRDNLIVLWLTFSNQQSICVNWTNHSSQNLAICKWWKSGESEQMPVTYSKDHNHWFPFSAGAM